MDIPIAGHVDAAGTVRVFALQYRIDLADTETPEAYRTAMRTLVERHVVPNLAADKENLVVFPEAIGLPALAAGPRGDAFRDAAAAAAPVPEGGMPMALMTGLMSLATAYEPQLAAVKDAFGDLHPVKALLLAATDNAARVVSQTFSEIARDYGVHVVAGNYQAAYRAAASDKEIEAWGCFGDDAAFVPVSSTVTNQTWLFAPTEIREAPAGERNLVFRNRKIPLTESEMVMLGLDNGPAEGAEARESAGYYELGGLRFGFATSLPAFAYGYSFGARSVGFDPYQNLDERYVAAQHDLGVDVMIQADANNGPWGACVENGSWQPVEWMGSTWRAVADPSVAFRYNVCPMMTGNLADMVFDGQSSITGRGFEGEPRHYVGAGALEGGDLPEYGVYAGPKTEFCALAPWASDDAPRPELEKLASALQAGSGSERSGDYVSTALFADLVPEG